VTLYFSFVAKPKKAAPISLYVKTLTGKTLSLGLDPSSTIEDLKVSVFNRSTLAY